MNPSRFNFRAWDKATSSMMCVHHLTYSSIPHEPSSVVEEIALGEDQRESKDFILMQSTGLSDKNGKEIFEGDIVNIVGAKKDAYPPAVIKWYDCWAAFMVEFAYPDEWFEEIHRYNLEVAGNIHENPELLK